MPFCADHKNGVDSKKTFPARGVSQKKKTSPHQIFLTLGILIRNYGLFQKKLTALF
jgi:hypothetical protein